MKKITVIVPTYNHEKYIDQCLISIIKQKTKYSFSILIGDDGSQDGTPERVKEIQNRYPELVTLILRSNNVGTKNNVLDLISRAEGQYIAFLEGDDYWLGEEKIEKMVDFLEDNQSHVGAFHNIKVVDSFGRENFRHEYNHFEGFSDINTVEEHFSGKLMLTLSMVFRNIFKDENKYNELSALLGGVKNVSDYSIKSYLLLHGGFRYFSEIWGCYRFVDSGGSSWSASPQIERYQDFLLIYKRHIGFFGKIAEKGLDGSYFVLFLKCTLLNIKQRKYRSAIKTAFDFDYDVLIRPNVYKDVFVKSLRRLKRMPNK